jgi:hypothetical protein
MSSLDTVFQGKFEEFCTDLEGACPELKPQIDAARALPAEERLRRFVEEVKASPQRDGLACPGCVLPGVTIPEGLWNDLSENSKKAIQEYLTLLTMCSLYHSNVSWMDLSGQEGFVKEFLEHWKTRMGSADFKGLAERFAKFVESASGAGAGGAGAIPSLPERFLKGKIAKLAEELVREFRPEDFGLTTAQLEECERNPARAFEILLQAYTTRPEILQNAMQKIAKRMQQKIQRGELKPQDLAREAEDILRECTSNPAFQGMMESFRDSFGAFADPDMARSQGRDGDARLQLARERLRKERERRAKKKAEGKK